MSNKFLFTRFCELIGKPHYARDVEPMKSESLRRIQEDQWNRLSRLFLNSRGDSSLLCSGSLSPPLNKT
jgi:hypothetical protein